ncbi:hypothetical protein [Arenimonas oryziterrae]|uniref:DUF11 domain-containing protein n=1 Tax=Arenimonas oryziterrae DSM 21050 = YC6267 TaxID=1121015 RepID=A0A091BFR7_9GAMM|nr:hypothetical protein [Arenimonas oryziterrae]KFN43225.1 hypothetical protein N789_11740 [Arenimonas oryziterrae DSM 21050 = YC6267]
MRLFDDVSSMKTSVRCPRRVIVAALALAMLPALSFAQVVTTCPAALETTQLFSYTGAPTTFVVPANVSAVRIIAVGADGGANTDAAFAGGAGAQAEGTFAVTAGQVFTIIAGEAPPGGDLEAGGGGASGAYLAAALAVIAGGGGGDDNTGAGGGGTATNNGGNGGNPAGGDCTLGGLGGTGGAGGENGELGSPTQACQTGDGGAGGGGFNSAGGSSDDVAATAPAHRGPSGGGQCSIAGAAGGTAGLRDPTDGTSDGARGGFGLCGGGGSDHRESGGGGGYSGGGGGPEGALPGGGGSFVGATATTPTLTAGTNGGGSGRNGSVRVCYTTRANLGITKDDGVVTRLTGSTATYTINVTNAGPASANGAIVRDAGGVPGLNCTTAVCTATGGAQCPGGAVNGAGVAVPIASLQAGVAIPTFPTTGNIAITLTCNVTATGF